MINQSLFRKTEKQQNFYPAFGMLHIVSRGWFLFLFQINEIKLSYLKYIFCNNKLRYIPYFLKVLGCFSLYVVFYFKAKSSHRLVNGIKLL